MQLAGKEHDKLYNRLVTLVRYSLGSHAPVKGTWSVYKKKQAAIIEAIAKDVPYFRVYEGLWPIVHISRRFLQNQDSRFRTALLEQKCYEKNVKREPRRKGRQKKAQVVNAAGTEDEDEELELEDEELELELEDEDEECEEWVDVKTKAKPTQTRAKAAPVKSKPKRTPSYNSDEDSEAGDGLDSVLGSEEGSEAAFGEEHMDEGDGLGEERGVDENEGGEDEGSVDEDEDSGFGKLHVAQWTEKMDDDKDEDASQAQQTKRQAKKRNNLQVVLSDTDEDAKDAPIRLKTCLICNDTVPNRPSSRLEELRDQLRRMDKHSPDRPNVRQAICAQIKFMRGQELALSMATQQHWPIQLSMDRLPRQIFEMREDIKALLVDPEELAKNIIFRRFLRAIDFQVADYNTAFRKKILNSKLLDKVWRFRTAAYFGIPGFYRIRSCLFVLVQHLLPEYQLSMTLSSVAEDAERSQHPWQLTEDGAVDFSAPAFIETVLVAHVTIAIIMKDLDIDFNAALGEFVKASSVTEFFARRTNSWLEDDIKHTTVKMLKLLRVSDKANAASDETDDRQSKTKRKVHEVEQPENPKPKKFKKADKENTKIKAEKMKDKVLTGDDFAP
ncbi:hypothetical protein C8F01DRAFT_1372133, partial [Mycena amicta]